MNILILAAGTRNKIVQYFRKAVGKHGNIIATDASEYSPAIYDADKYYIVPTITDLSYLEKIFDICKKEKISSKLTLNIAGLIKEKKAKMAKIEDLVVFSKDLQWDVRCLLGDEKILEEWYGIKRGEEDED